MVAGRVRISWAYQRRHSRSYVIIFKVVLLLICRIEFKEPADDGMEWKGEAHMPVSRVAVTETKHKKRLRPR